MIKSSKPKGKVLSLFLALLIALAPVSGFAAYAAEPSYEGDVIELPYSPYLYYPELEEVPTPAALMPAGMPVTYAVPASIVVGTPAYGAEVFLEWHYEFPAPVDAGNWPATYGEGASSSRLEFFYANGTRATLGRNQNDRVPVNVPNNAGGWFPAAGEITANNSAGWVITLSTLGYEDITFSAQQASSNSGPGEFGLAYRIGENGTWTEFAANPRARVSELGDIPSGFNTDTNPWETLLGDTFVDVALPATVYDQLVVQIKVFIASDRIRLRETNPDVALDPAGGNTSMNNIVFRGVATGVTQVTGVTVTPNDAVVLPGQTQQFTANVTTVGDGYVNTGVTWSVNSTVSTISATGLLTVAAGETVSPLTVTATSVGDDTVSGTATVLTEQPPFDVPGFEVAFLLDADRVLDADGNFRLEYRELLLGGAGSAVTGGLPGRERRLNIQWMDTPEQIFNQHGWINRIRHRHWQPNPFQLTYRTRMPIAWPVTNEGIQAALMEAELRGFDDTNWSYEIDWSYDSAVLTVSHSLIQLPYDQVHGLVPPLDLPDEAASREILINHMPDVLRDVVDWDWYVQNLARVVKHGPVYYRRYDNRSPIGLTIPGGLTIEVMPLMGPDGNVELYVVEASFETDGLGFEATAGYRAALQDLLEDAGILLHRSGLRTSTVLARYKREVNGDDGDDNGDDDCDNGYGNGFVSRPTTTRPRTPAPAPTRPRINDVSRTAEASITLAGTSVDIRRSGSRADLALTSAEVRDIINNLDGDTIVFNLGTLDGFENVREARVPRTVLRRIADAGLSVEVVLPQGTVTLNPEALRYITAVGTGQNISISIGTPSRGLLTPRQRNTIHYSDEVFRLVIMSGRQIIDRFDGEATVVLPTGGRVYHLADNGILTLISDHSSFTTNQSAVFIVRSR